MKIKTNHNKRVYKAMLNELAAGEVTEVRIYATHLDTNTFHIGILANSKLPSFYLYEGFNIDQEYRREKAVFGQIYGGRDLEEFGLHIMLALKRKNLTLHTQLSVDDNGKLTDIL